MIRPSLRRLLVLAIAALAVVCAALTAGCATSSDSSQTDSRWQVAPEGATVISFAVSPEKEPLLRPLIEQFNASRPEVDGQTVFVEASTIASGDAELKIADGTLRPTVWSPASSLWGRLLNFDTDSSMVADDNMSLVRTPLVIAMWEPMARALGHPARPVGFDDILTLAEAPDGWASAGLPQFGQFKLVHTNPDFSTAGLSAVAAEYFSAAGQREGLTAEQVAAGPVRDRVRGIEQSIVHYGDTTLFIADQLVARGPGYASAVAMEEVTLLDVNRRLAKAGSPYRMVAVYPKDGTFFSDNPFLILNAPWSAPQQRQGAQLLGRFLTEHLTARAAGRYGFRPADPRTSVAPVLASADGVNVSEPQRELGLPQPKVLDAIRRSWREDRKAANVLLVVDTSGSMAGSRIDQAKKGLRTFVRQLAPQDRVGLMTFSADVHDPKVEIGLGEKNRAALTDEIDRLGASGGTAFHDATVAAFERVRRLNDTERINAVVLLTDGEDSDSDRSADDVIAALKAANAETQNVRVFTIAYSDGADGAQGTLTEIAAASGGKSYTGDPDSIDSVYRSISSFF
jgi:Ca-activated chloride channel family protein